MRAYRDPTADRAIGNVTREERRPMKAQERQKLIIPGTLIGLNEYTAANRGNRYAGAKIKGQAEHVIATAIRQAKMKPTKSKVLLHYTWFEPNRRRDHDNVAFAQKFVQDALVKAGILRTDGWDGVAGFTHAFEVDKRNPRVEVMIEECRDAP